MTLKELQKEARGGWTKSGLTDADAKKLRFEILTAAQVEALGKTHKTKFLNAPALRMPYFDEDGRLTKFFRIRYLEMPAGSFLTQLEEEPRYAQPVGTINEVYLPPLLDRTWKEVLADPKIPLYITEGEKKSACGCKHGLHVIGLGGVDMWKASKRMLDMLPTLKGVDWNEREVTIVFDSDAAYNPHIVRALTALAQALLNLGAKVRIASLPPSKILDKDGKPLKQGLDDYIVNHGAEALKEVLGEAHETPESIALWQMNEKVAVVRNIDAVLELSTDTLRSSVTFTNIGYSNAHYMQAKKNKDGDIYFQSAKLAPRWLEWERRNEVARITYAPGQPRITSAREWNTWKGWGCEPLKSTLKDVKPFHDLTKHLFADEDEKVLTWFMRWLAYPLQHPGTKLFTDVLIWGGQGIGKSQIGYTMFRIYGEGDERNARKVTSKELTGGFNSWAANKQFIMGEEITGSDRRETADLLKDMITQHEISINKKYAPVYTVPDCINYYFNSNHPDAFFIDDDDRRHCIIHSSRPPIFMPDEKRSLAFFREYDKWKNGDGPRYLFDHLLKLDLGDFSPTAPAIQTNAKRTMIHTGKSDLGAWVVNLRENTAITLRAIGNEAKARECALFTSEELRHAYDPEKSTRVTAGSMAKELARAGFRQVNGGNPVAVNTGRQRLFAVRDVERWTNAETKDIADHFNRFAGKKF